MVLTLLIIILVLAIFLFIVSKLFNEPLVYKDDEKSSRLDVDSILEKKTQADKINKEVDSSVDEIETKLLKIKNKNQNEA